MTSRIGLTLGGGASEEIKDEVLELKHADRKWFLRGDQDEDLGEAVQIIPVSLRHIRELDICSYDDSQRLGKSGTCCASWDGTNAFGLGQRPSDDMSIQSGDWKALVQERSCNGCPSAEWQDSGEQWPDGRPKKVKLCKPIAYMCVLWRRTGELVRHSRWGFWKAKGQMGQYVQQWWEQLEAGEKIAQKEDDPKLASYAHDYRITHHRPNPFHLWGREMKLPGTMVLPKLDEYTALSEADLNFVHIMVNTEWEEVHERSLEYVKNSRTAWITANAPTGDDAGKIEMAGREPPPPHDPNKEEIPF